MKKILLVDDHKVIRDAFRYYFTEDSGYEIHDEAINGKEALNLLESNTYDIIITDINMPVMDGVELVTQIREKDKEQKILALSMSNEIRIIKKMLALNINGYILKEAGKDEVVHALENILSGENYFSPDVSRTVLESMTSANLKPKKRLTVEVDLSNREKEILKLIMEEKSNQDIADELFISVRTVEGHKNNMLIKTGCKNLVGLTKYAVEKNLVPLP